MDTFWGNPVKDIQLGNASWRQPVVGSQNGYFRRYCMVAPMAENCWNIWFEPTDPNVATTIFNADNNNVEAVKFISPNFHELQAIHGYIFGPNSDTAIKDKDNLKGNEITEIASHYSSKVLERFPSMHAILVTIGKYGIVYSSRDPDLDSSITLGPDSSLFKHKSNAIRAHHFEQKFTDQVVNVSGAGDSMVGAIVVGLIENCSIRKSLDLGLKAAHLSIMVQDTISKNISEILLEN